MAVTTTVELNLSGSTWTDVSAYLESEITISGGRQDELSQADPNQCSLTLDNRDGRFTPGKTTGAYYPNVKVGVGLRVTVSLDGGLTSSRRFTGFVDSWTVQWEDGQDACKVDVQASSIMSRLGLLCERKSAVEEEILVDGPTLYYPLSDPAGSASAFNESGITSASLVGCGEGAAFVFGNAVGPPADDLTAAQFNGGQYLQVTSLPLFTPNTMECFFSASPGAVSGGVFFLVGSAPTGIVIDGTTGALRSFAGTSAGTGAIDGQTHHVAITWASGTETIYVDGQVAGSSAVVAPAAVALFNVGIPVGAVTNSPIVIAHAAAHTTALAAARIADHYTAGKTAFKSETVTARLARYASWAKYGAVSSASTTTVTNDTYAGASVVDLMHNLETTDGGALYDARDNTITLQPRQARYTAATAATFNAAADQLESSYSPVTDRQNIANEVTVTGGDGTTAKVTDTASQATYGVARTSIEMLTTEAQAPLARAQWEVAARSTPRERVPTLGVDVLNCGLPAATVLALTVGSRVAVTNPPSQAAAAGDYFIEGWSETFDPTSYGITFNVSPAQPWVNTLILDDPTRGVLDSTYVLAY